MHIWQESKNSEALGSGIKTNNRLHNHTTSGAIFSFNTDDCAKKVFNQEV